MLTKLRQSTFLSLLLLIFSLLLFHSKNPHAWTLAIIYRSGPRQHHERIFLTQRRQQQPLASTESENESLYTSDHRQCTRRHSIQKTLRFLALSTSTCKGAAFVSSTAANAQQDGDQQKLTQPPPDPFAAFGEQILQDLNNTPQQTQQRPYNAESPVSPGRSSPSNAAGLTDMEKALQQAKQQKRIDPRTHG